MFAEPLAGAFDLDDDGVVEQAVEQVRLAGERLLDALAQQRPAFAVDVEVAAQVEWRTRSPSRSERTRRCVW